jgi:5-hydroxyisourate hydrolase-like protein (transthyretin family)
MTAKRNPRGLFLSLSLLLFIALLAPSCVQVPAADADIQPAAEARLSGEQTAGGLSIRLRPGPADLWPAAAEPRVWLANLDGKTIARATTVNYEPDSPCITANFAKPIPAATVPLTLVRFDFGNSDSPAGSFSLAEVLGSLQLHLLGPDEFQVGTPGSVRVMVADRFSGRPLTGATVRLALRAADHETALFEGATDAAGTCRVAFQVPDETLEKPSLAVVATWQGQQTEVDYPVTLRRDAKILLTTDKPLYQPGQTMHLRALAIMAGLGRPVAGQEAVLEVQDSKGNKVFKKRARTDKHGIFHATFALADRINLGPYKISAFVGDNTAEKTVEVKHYVLPKFKLALSADRAWYLPGAAVKGTLDAQYVFGKPVTGAAVAIEGLATIVGVQTFATIEGKTDDKGRFDFELKLPDTLTGRPVDQGLARVQFHATVIDATGHRQEALKSYPVARAPLTVQLLPESGELVPGVDNRVFVMVATPDGAAVSGADVRVSPGKPPREDGWWNQESTVATDQFGLAELTVPVSAGATGLTLTTRARDDAGNEVETTIRLRSPQTPLPLLLRTDAPTYRFGETMRLTAMTGRAATPTVFFDVIRDNQTLLTASAVAKDGRAEISVPASADLTGSLVVTAYVFAREGNLVRDSRVVYVNPEGELDIAIKPSRQTYRPGEQATIDFAVTGPDGHPVAAALGVTIVDEAVFALQDMQPGLEKVFFTLEKELMKPRYEFHSFMPATIVLEPTPEHPRRRAQEAMLSAIAPAITPPVDEKVAADLSAPVREAMQQRVTKDVAKLSKLFVKYNGEKNRIAIADLRDAWFTPYRIGANGKNLINLTSAGPDRRFHTEDDLTAENPEYVVAKGRRLNDRRARGGFGEMALQGMAAGAARLANEPAVDALANKAVEETKTDGDDRQTKSPGVRVREFFPETLFVDPALITDARGRARIELPMADSITTWRIAAQAVSPRGWLGSSTAPIRVFQDFFVDIDFPVALTRGDRVKVPIALYNYLDTKQTVTLRIQGDDWFELVEGGLTRKITLGPGEVTAEQLDLKATRVGRHTLTVVAEGSKQSDAVKRAATVRPDGKLHETAFNDRLQDEATHTIAYPDQAIEGANELLVKIHPGMMSQVVEGLDNIFRMPSGCFEQTSSTTYPNIMLLDYLKATKQVTPELQMKAEGFINQGYQRLLTFEVPGGGFEWFGRAPAHVILTAYGLMEFSDMSRVHNVDPDVIARTQRWLADKQLANGSWEPNSNFLDRVAAKFGQDVLRNTAYVTWALARTGYTGPALSKARGFLQKHHAEAKDAYTVALLANALVRADAGKASIDAVFKHLAALRTDRDDVSFWPSPEATPVGSRGQSADIETTALAGLALLADKREPQTVNRITTYLIQSKDAFGTYYSTQATVFALDLLLQAARGAASDIEGVVDVLLNDRSIASFTITPDDADVLRQLDATEYLRPGANNVRLTFAGRGVPSYQIVGRHYLPWSGETKDAAAPLSIDVAYDKTKLAVDETVACTVKVRNNVAGDFGMVVVDVGVPPGFAPDRAGLSQLVEKKLISRFSTTARQVTFYLDRLERGAPVELSFKLTAQFPMHAVAPESTVYNYYDPATKTIAEPIKLKVGD